MLAVPVKSKKLSRLLFKTFNPGDRATLLQDKNSLLVIVPDNLSYTPNSPLTLQGKVSSIW